MSGLKASLAQGEHGADFVNQVDTAAHAFGIKL
jgi:hypothetical protein